jgi:hypothetical protein
MISHGSNGTMLLTFLTHHFPNNGPEKTAAWAAVERAQRLLNQAANKIAPAFNKGLRPPHLAGL